MKRSFIIGSSLIAFSVLFAKKNTDIDSTDTSVASVKNQLNSGLAELGGELNSSYADQMIGVDGPINAVINIRSKDDAFYTTVEIKNGLMKIIENSKVDYPDADAVLTFYSAEVFKQYINASSDEAIRMFLDYRIMLHGNEALFGYFMYLRNLQKIILPTQRRNSHIPFRQ